MRMHKIPLRFFPNKGLKYKEIFKSFSSIGHKGHSEKLYRTRSWAMSYRGWKELNNALWGRKEQTKERV